MPNNANNEEGIKNLLVSLKGSHAQLPLDQAAIGIFCGLNDEGFKQLAVRPEDSYNRTFLHRMAFTQLHDPRLSQPIKSFLKYLLPTLNGSDVSRFMNYALEKANTDLLKYILNAVQELEAEGVRALNNVPPYQLFNDIGVVTNYVNNSKGDEQQSRRAKCQALRLVVPKEQRTPTPAIFTTRSSSATPTQTLVRTPTHSPNQSFGVASRAMSTTLQQLQDQVAAVGAENQRLLRELTFTKSQVTQLHRKIASQDALQKQLAAAGNDINELRAQTQLLREQRGQLEVASARLEVSNKELNDRIGLAQVEVEKKTREHDALIERNLELAGSLLNAQKVAAQATQEVQCLRDQLKQSDRIASIYTDAARNMMELCTEATRQADDIKGEGDGSSRKRDNDGSGLLPPKKKFAADSPFKSIGSGAVASNAGTQSDSSDNPKSSSADEEGKALLSAEPRSPR